MLTAIHHAIRVGGHRLCALRLPLVFLPALLLAVGCARPVLASEFQINQSTTLGSSVYVLGDAPELGGGDVRRALKLSPHAYPVWSARVELLAGAAVRYRYLLRSDAATDVGTTSNATAISATTLTLNVGGTPPAPSSGVLFYLSGAPLPVLEVANADGSWRRLPFAAQGAGRNAGEQLWRAPLSDLPAPAGSREPLWSFRIDLGGGSYDNAPGGGPYRTALASAWLQDGQLYDYRPAAQVSAPRVIKLPAFTGRLPTRPLYVYLPRGYDEHTTRSYPVLYMHDGQNCFVAQPDGPFGTWQADTIATRLIAQGRMRECIIVGVGHGGTQRIHEYLPPESTYDGIAGRGDITGQYYTLDVRPYVEANYRCLRGREHTALCGSSMGGVISLYFAREFNGFARHIAALSTAFWTTPELQAALSAAAPNDIRLWLDSGTVSGHGTGNDGLPETYAMRDALLMQGWTLGRDFQHYVDIGAAHTESAWAGRLDRVFVFLFPVSQQPSSLNQSAAAPAWQVYGVE